jgi:hypothetical protein
MSASWGTLVPPLVDLTTGVFTVQEGPQEEWEEPGAQAESPGKTDECCLLPREVVAPDILEMPATSGLLGVATRLVGSVQGERANALVDDAEIPKVEEEKKEKQDENAVYEGVAAGKHIWGDRKDKTDADKDVQGEAIKKHSWVDGRNRVSIHIELDGMDDVADDAFVITSAEREVTLAIAGVAGKNRRFALKNLSAEIDSVKYERKKGKNTIVLKLINKEVTPWHSLQKDLAPKEEAEDCTAGRDREEWSCHKVMEAIQRLRCEGDAASQAGASQHAHHCYSVAADVFRKHTPGAKGRGNKGSVDLMMAVKELEHSVAEARLKHLGPEEQAGGDKSRHRG